MTPDQMLRRWHARLRKRGYDVMMDGFVRRLNIKYDDKFEHTCWFEKKNLFDFHVDVQKAFDRPVGYFYNVPESFHEPRPAQQTATELSKIVDADERAKMFMAAIIIGEKRAYLGYEQIWGALGLYDYKIWNPNARFTIPYSYYFDTQWLQDAWPGEEKLRSSCELIDYMADVTAAIMETNVLVTFVFGDEPDVAVINHIEHKLKVERQRRAAIDAELETIRHRDRLRDSWNNLSFDEMQTMIWSKPITELAKESGYSDAYVHKRCRQLGIKTPPRGFWAKVHAGAIPHPNGVAQA